MIFDPPNLAKSPLRSDSIKILTKRLLHYSRKGVRMPKFRNFYRTSPEISTFFSLFSYSVSWQGRRGPFPWLEDCECKRARPPSDQVFCRSASVWSIGQALPELSTRMISHALSSLNVWWQRPSGTAIMSETLVQHV